MRRAFIIGAGVGAALTASWLAWEALELARAGALP